MGLRPSKHPAVPKQARPSLPYIYAATHDAEGDFEHTLQRSTVPRKVHVRHERCWSCLVSCLCSGHAVPEEAQGQQRSVIRHLALLTAEYFSQAPGIVSWVRGLRAVKRETRAEDEAFFAQCVPEPSCWPAEHFALDLGTGPPAGAAEGSNDARLPLEEAVRAAAHFASFALAAYSLKLQVLMHPGQPCLHVPFCRVSSARAFCELAGVPLADVLHAELRARPFKPSWWLCLDRASRAVVVAVRGTFGPADLLSDALARQVQHDGYVLHEGVLASAKWLLVKLKPRLREVEQLRSGFRLVVTGHSLGGAVAAILAWLLRSGEDGIRGVQCFTYGAPLVVDQQLARLMERFVIGVVHHNDLIPRLGRKSLEDLRDRVAELSAPTSQRLRELEAVLAEFALPTEPRQLRDVLKSGGSLWCTARGRSGSGEWQDAAEDVSELPALPMFNPGWQLHLQRRGVRHRALELLPVLSKRMTRGMLITARTPSPAHMQAIRPCFTMWTDHWPQGYLYVLEAFSERLEAKRQAGPRPELWELLRRLEEYFGGGAGLEA